MLTVGATDIAARPDVIPALAIGSVLMVMIYAGGHISGAHYNPAVTVAVFLRGRCAAADVVPYWTRNWRARQQHRAFCWGSRLRKRSRLTPTSPPDLHPKFFFTFALAYVVLNVATAKATAGNSYFGLAIGFTVLAGAFSVGHVSGGAFNPAVAFGAMIMGMLPWAKLWLYLAAQLLAAGAAGLLFEWLNPEDR